VSRNKLAQLGISMRELINDREGNHGPRWGMIVTIAEVMDVGVEISRPKWLLKAKKGKNYTLRRLPPLSR
jgi:hypothetical protein